MSVTSVSSGLVTPLEFSRDIIHEGSVRAQTHASIMQHVEAVKQAEVPVSEARHGDSKPQIHSTAEDLEQISLVFNKKLKFEIDHGSHQVIVKVIDRETDKVIKELPPEELQRLHNNLKETIGFLFDEQV